MLTNPKNWIKPPNCSDPKKRPIAAVADNIELRNVKSLTIKRNTKIKIRLLFDSNRSLVKRIKSEIKRQKSAKR